MDNTQRLTHNRLCRSNKCLDQIMRERVFEYIWRPLDCYDVILGLTVLCVCDFWHKFLESYKLQIICNADQYHRILLNATNA